MAEASRGSASTTGLRCRTRPHVEMSVESRTPAPVGGKHHNEASSSACAKRHSSHSGYRGERVCLHQPAQRVVDALVADADVRLQPRDAALPVRPCPHDFRDQLKSTRGRGPRRCERVNTNPGSDTAARTLITKLRALLGTKLVAYLAEAPDTAIVHGWLHGTTRSFPDASSRSPALGPRSWPAGRGQARWGRCRHGPRGSPRVPRAPAPVPGRSTARYRPALRAQCWACGHRARADRAGCGRCRRAACRISRQPRWAAAYPAAAPRPALTIRPAIRNGMGSTDSIRPGSGWFTDIPRGEPHQVRQPPGEQAGTHQARAESEGCPDQYQRPHKINFATPAVLLPRCPPECRLGRLATAYSARTCTKSLAKVLRLHFTEQKVSSAGVLPGTLRKCVLTIVTPHRP